MRRFRGFVAGAGVLLFFHGAIGAQPLPPAFDVATIKPSNMPLVVPGQKGGVYRVGIQMDASGFFRCSYFDLRSMIAAAWNVKTDQVVVSDWATHGNFEVEARMPPGTSQANAMLMFQNLLTTRFQMNVKTEERSTAVFSLVLAPKGSKLKATEKPPDSETSGTYQVIAPAMSIGGLAKRLSMRTDRPVIDETGLAGNYEMKLTWEPDGPDGMAIDNLFRALREQLGLELKASKASVTFYVVDKALKVPIEN